MSFPLCQHGHYYLARVVMTGLCPALCQSLYLCKRQQVRSSHMSPEKSDSDPSEVLCLSRRFNCSPTPCPLSQCHCKTIEMIRFHWDMLFWESAYAGASLDTAGCSKVVMSLTMWRRHLEVKLNLGWLHVRKSNIQYHIIIWYVHLCQCSWSKLFMITSYCMLKRRLGLVWKCTK